MISKGFVAILSAPLSRAHVAECAASWLERFERLEQVTPEPGSVATIGLKKVEDIMWENNMQFRVLNGEEFAWIYLTLDKRCIETSGLPAPLPDDAIALCLDVLLELPGVTTVVDQANERRLEELEAEGLL
ncbi:hypothetical protein DB346_02745 [Verrucomicrobia bacterium LW23]|nr:hypothetical protein DB346_03910 [Verrucomicrobia bacterium LW23]PTY04366.1 hypothetical protein DB346_02745 [Verrucomicrobia bacterium LW23]